MLSRKGRPLSNKSLAQAETCLMLKRGERRVKKAGKIVEINNHTL
jgi:hypothetical protein